MPDKRPGALPNYELTTTEKLVLRHYREHVDAFKKLPSLRELSEYTGLSFTTCRYHLLGLEKKGYLEKKPVTVMRMKLSHKGRKIDL